MPDLTTNNEQRTTINWGIIGCGNVTEVKSGPAFSKIPGSSCYAVMCRDAVKAEDYARRHNIPVWYSNAYELINDPNVHAIYVATPPSSHEEYVIAALEAGKPVYVEKPMALNAESCRRMEAAAVKNNTKLVVAHYRRAMAYFLKIKSLLPELGNLKTIDVKFLQPPVTNLVASSETNWRVDPAVSGGGLFHDMAPHHLDLMNWFFGYPVSISGFSANQSGSSKADDIVSALLVFKGDITFTGTWCFDSPGQVDRCEIIGEKGVLSFPFHGNEITLTLGTTAEKYPFIHTQHIQQPMIEQVVAYFKGETEVNPCPAIEGVKTMEIMDKITM